MMTVLITWVLLFEAGLVTQRGNLLLGFTTMATPAGNRLDFVLVNSFSSLKLVCKIFPCHFLILHEVMKYSG